jgi:hypothetical protein
MEEPKSGEGRVEMIAATNYVRPEGPWDTNAAPLPGSYSDPANTGADPEPVSTAALSAYGDDGQAERNAAMKAEADAAHRERTGRVAQREGPFERAKSF